MVMTIPTNVKMTEQAPCSDRELKAIDIPRRLLPVQRTNASTKTTPMISRPIGPQITPAMSTIAVMFVSQLFSGVHISSLL